MIEFTLEHGMLCVHANGKKSIVIKHPDHTGLVSDGTDNMTPGRALDFPYLKSTINKDNNITHVYERLPNSTFMSLDVGKRKLLWSRESHKSAEALHSIHQVISRNINNLNPDDLEVLTALILNK